ncbi:hypothetical protein K6U44_13935 [Vibrio parahaemolyticus]|uniref:hypothetical protein n=1 Tax=Vibrio parahaemolyticus TaxID=670 RepID=UPI001EECBBCB|nr:hypothetical protein [Vibrio parahaemolyticus]EJC1211557.1 hypothetical protein [Vibrio parahaemolyticus]EJG0937357.1 hypothetical protein [Vibrio parahaemolyticus]EJG1997231.1 hypothetical protein [Vibrio parahaemolyticus]MCG6461535.1 hypothetical protein [Vibrio parahaemolyticus]
MKFGNIDIGELKPVPELESGDEKEVFAFYGLASFNAQCTEKALVNFAMGYKLVDESALTQEQWLELYDRLNSNTFGRLLGQIKNRVDLPDTLLAHLDETLQKRNWLAHDFFYDYAIHMTDFDGRAQMISQLQCLITMFQIADRAIEKLSSIVWQQFGVDEAWIQKEMAMQFSEYQSAKDA